MILGPAPEIRENNWSLFLIQQVAHRLPINNDLFFDVIGSTQATNKGKNYEYKIDCLAYW